MLLMLLCLGAALVVLLLSPVVLTVGRWQVRFPRIALTLWFAAFFVGCALAAGSVLAAILAGLTTEHTAGVEPVIVTVLAWLSLVATGAVIAIVAGVSEPLVGSHRAEVQALTPLVSSREQRQGFVIGHVVSDVPVAVAVRRPERMILVSTGLMAALTPPQLQAVLAHELAHLRGRHDWAMRIAEVNAACLPARLPAGSALRRATALLIELAADDAAARQAGAVHLANALTRLAELTGDVSMGLRAQRLALRRWRPTHRLRVPEAVRL